MGWGEEEPGRRPSLSGVGSRSEQKIPLELV